MKLLVLWGLLAASLSAQTTQGIIRGRIVDAVDEEPLGDISRITCYADMGTEVSSINSDHNGYYSFALLPPGNYWLRVRAASYQPAEVHNVDVPVAGIVEQNFQLRPITDIFAQQFARQLVLPQSKNLLRFYGPDLDLSRIAFLRPWESGIHMFEPSLSNVIDPRPIRDLPFAGRDLYTMLLTQPAVTSDTGTQRSLGLSANGQRPASSNFLLDGLELNNSLIAGPLIAVPPEAIQEYRISINGYSAEFGHTAGFLANVVSRSGGERWHGVVYRNHQNEALNANDFQNNLAGLARPRSREWQAGFQAGGRVVAERLYISSSFDYLAAAGRQALQGYVVPGGGFLNFLQTLSSSNPARKLFELFPPPASTVIRNEPFAGDSQLRRSVTQNRALWIQRIDTMPSANRRLAARLITSRLSWPDFIWSPYTEFMSGLHQKTTGIGLTLKGDSPQRRLAHELRFGSHWSRFGWDRAHPEMPTLTVSGGNPGARQVLLPGSPAAYSFDNVVRSTEAGLNVLLWRGRHLIKMGGSSVFRSIGDALPYGAAGRYDFPSLPDLAFASRIRLFVPLSRTALAAGNYQAADFSRDYRHRRMAAFVEDSLRLNRRATLNAGLRYEQLGSPTNVSQAESGVFEFGSGPTLADRLRTGQFRPTNVHGTPVYGTDRGDLGIRLGFAYNLGSDSATAVRPVLRAGYGVYFDQMFDNVWLNVRNNSFVFPSTGFEIPDGSNYLLRPPEVISRYSLERPASDFPTLTAFERGLRSGAAHHYFAGIQARLFPGVVFEATALGAVGRHLITTDTVNRQFSLDSTAAAPAGCDNSRFQPCLPDIAYRGNDGSSAYHAFTISLASRTPRHLLSIAYTLGHTIDNQSDPLKGDFFDLTFAAASKVSGFARQFDSRGDRSSSDFDQRQNLVVYSIWNLPAARKWSWLLKGWRVSQIAAFRSGFPFTITDQVAAPVSGGLLLTRRADLIFPDAVRLSHPEPVPGGLRLLDRKAFCAPESCAADRSRMGNTGRNSFLGPGLYNLDVSVSRTFALTRLREGTHLIVRADALNALNHANLGAPRSDLSSNGTFGTALYGRPLRDIGVPALLPLRETGRQIRILLRVEF